MDCTGGTATDPHGEGQVTPSFTLEPPLFVYTLDFDI